jgi:UDP-glucose 4-epimerase
MKCIVTGGGGFIGSNIVDRLVNDGHEVIIIDNLSSGKKEFLNKKAYFYNIDLSVNQDLYMFKDVDFVFHVAAFAEVDPSIKNPLPYHNANINATLNILLACRKYNIKRMIYSASSSCYGNPTEIPTTENAKIEPMSPYALQKLVGEEYCRLFSNLYGLETVCLRYFNVYGNRQRNEGAYALVTGIFLRQLNNGEVLTITGDGEQERDFVNVSDVVEANILASTSNKVGCGESINIGNGVAITINEIANAISNNICYVEKRHEPDITLSDISKAYELLGWKPKADIKKWIENIKYSDLK